MYNIPVAVYMHFWCTCMYTGVYALYEVTLVKCIYTGVNALEVHTVRDQKFSYIQASSSIITSVDASTWMLT